VLRPVADGMKRFAHDGYLKRDDSDQITGSSISSMHVASIWETTPITDNHVAFWRNIRPHMWRLC
ncbi:MAG: hypothetical protein ACRC5V_12360, partial [Aeromonas sp.]